MLTKLIKELNTLKDSKKAEHAQRFFKTGKGEYGQGDIFIGIRVPVLRKTAGRYKTLLLKDVKKLLESKIHEHRFVALVILIKKFSKQQEKIYDFYMDNLKHINNWDLVDISAPKIAGKYLLDKDKSVLYDLARSENLWKKRIAIISTFEFIKNDRFRTALEISEILSNDSHDLIHKAVGWMLREIGKRNLDAEEEFLKKHYKKMPRTMLRYAIEKFGENKRKAYLKGTI
ncbi:DNA alkylation repair protein [Candidatus Woesearchaeota archaeon]|nr:DNA alkylation repair protein [Candidatus Woesearchaeota archaeon]